MIFQRASELTIRAMIFLAQQGPGKLSPAHEIARHVGASETYLAKIMHRLASAGLIRSFRGPGKGMELGRAPSTITLASLIRAVEGVKTEGDCVLGLGNCSEENPCALHKEWVPIRTAIRDLLEETTLADLAEIVRSRTSKTEKRLIGVNESFIAADMYRGRRHL